jgi:hypothetical protein
MRQGESLSFRWNMGGVIMNRQGEPYNLNYLILRDERKSREDVLGINIEDGFPRF